MARIKKKGLDYFPMGVEFVGSREVRRLVKREGEGAYMVLSFLISDLYGGEGYYLPVDEDYYEDLADRLFTMETDDVRCIVKSTIELGIFDNEMFMTHGILTSADIQRQYLFCAKSKNVTLEEEKYRLLSNEEMENLLPKKRKKVEVLCENNDLSSKNSENTYQSTQIKEKEIKENKTSEKESKEKEPDAAVPPKGSSKPVKEWTREDIERLEPPADGLKRNFEGLKENLRLFRIPIPLQYAIICKTGYGLIGHPVWKGFVELRNKFGKFHSPGNFLLKLCNPSLSF